ncbi:MAG: ABC transporter substrate-binding protein [Finegoldia sp.]|nr:ABC transporter substrate-binding protein [Finegoldia sp.]
MKKFKKLILMGLCSVLSLTACSQQAKEAQKEESTSSQPQSQTGEEKKGGPVEIQFWYGLGSVAGETMEEIIADFNSSQDKVKVTGVQQADYDETYQKVQAAIAADKPPAVFIGSNVSEMAQAGILADLTEYIDDRTPVEDYLDVFMKPDQIDEKVYGFPAYGTTQVMYYRKDLLEKAGIDPKDAYSSWEKVYETSKKMREAGVSQWGHLPMWGPDNLMDIALSNSGTILSEDGKKVTINTPAWVDSWNFIRKQIFEDKTAKIESGGQGWEYWYKTIDNVMNGQATGYTGSSGDKGDLDFTKIDSCPQPGLNGNPAKPQAGGHSLLVPAKASKEQQEAAYEWISYFTSPEVSAKWSMKIGYIPVRKSAMDNEDYKKFIAENPYAEVPYKQALNATPVFVDPTKGQIYDALKIAADKVELENVDAKQALDEAQAKAQKALDESLSK